MKPINPIDPERWDPQIREARGRGTFGNHKLACTWRLLSALIDYGLPAYCIWQGPVWLGITAAAVVIANSGVYQGQTGTSVGKLITGTQLGLPVEHPGAETRQLVYPGVVRGVIRALINLFALLMPAVLVWNVLGIIFGRYHRCWADRWVKTIVIDRGWTMDLIERQEGHEIAMTYKAQQKALPRLPEGGNG